MSSEVQNSIWQPQDTLLKSDLLGQHAQAIIDVNQKLQQLGIDETISLPQICVVGDQSAGKSSLIEAISNIQMPKADRTCTRCPVAINLTSGSSSDTPWQCVVSVEQRYNYIKGQTVDHEHLLGPWEKRIDVLTSRLGLTSDKAEVANMISAAQLKILDPSVDFDLLVSNAEEREKVRPLIKFSPNIIRLDITEGLRPNLCFIDLPGVIMTMSDPSEKYLVELVANLVKEYIADPRNQIILTLPMSADVQTSTACSIIQDLGGDQRIQVVFTKPDCVTKTQQNFFIKHYLTKNGTGRDVDVDELNRFSNNCHFVMLSSSRSDELTLTDHETTFFQKSPWCELEEKYQSQLGTGRLTNCLREQLFSKTLTALPYNLIAIDKELARIGTLINDIPPMPQKESFQLKLHQVLEAFARDLTSRFCGDGEVSVKGPLRGLFLDFSQKIEDALPTVDYASQAEMDQMDETVSQIDEFLRERKTLKEQEPHLTGGPDEATTGRHFSIDDLRRMNNSLYHSGLPGELDSRAVDKSCCDALDCWATILKKFLGRVSSFVEKHVSESFDAMFVEHKTFGLYLMVEDWIRKFVKTNIQAEIDIATRVCKIEKTAPFTLDEETLSRLKTIEEQNFLEQRLAFRLDLARRQRDVEEGVHKKDRRDITKDTLSPDKFRVEAILAARTRAYYRIASRRFVDTICQRLRARILTICGEKLATSLKHHVQQTEDSDEDAIIQWMAVDPEKQHQRKGLVRKQEQLIEGRKYIQEVLGNASEREPSTPSISPSKRQHFDEFSEKTEPETPTKKQRLVRRSGRSRTIDRNINQDDGNQDNIN